MSRHRPIRGIVWTIGLCLLVGQAAGQSLDQRIAHLRQTHAPHAQAETTTVNVNSSRAAMNRTINDVALNEVPAGQALRWVAEVAGFNLILNEQALQQAGIDPDYPITIHLQRIGAGQLLRLITTQMSQDVPLILEVNPDYVRLLTREQANRHPIVRIYSIADLLIDIPNFDDAPDVSLDQIVSDSGSGSSDIWEDDSDAEDVVQLSREEKAMRIAELIRQTIHPEIWEVNGGLAGRITYFQGNLIIRAPGYVHGQIKLPGRGAAPVRPDRASLPSYRYQPHHGSGATVSRDMRYVTLTTRTSAATLEGFRQYSVQQMQQARRFNPPAGAGVSGIDYTQVGR